MALVVTAALTFTPIGHDIQPPCPDGLVEFWSTCITPHAARWIPTAYREEARHNSPSGDVTTPPPTIRELVAAYFPPWAVDAAMRVIGCETGWTFSPNAWNSSSGASGYFQHMPRYWKARSSAAGWAGADIFDPEANVAVAAWLWGQTGDWRHWVCRPGAG